MGTFKKYEVALFSDPPVKKIPMPSIEKELHDLIEDSKEYLKENTEKKQTDNITALDN